MLVPRAAVVQQRPLLVIRAIIARPVLPTLATLVPPELSVDTKRVRPTLTSVLCARQVTTALKALQTQHLLSQGTTTLSKVLTP